MDSRQDKQPKKAEHVPTVEPETAASLLVKGNKINKAINALETATKDTRHQKLQELANAAVQISDESTLTPLREYVNETLTKKLNQLQQAAQREAEQKAAEVEPAPTPQPDPIKPKTEEEPAAFTPSEAFSNKMTKLLVEALEKSEQLKQLMPEKFEKKENEEYKKGIFYLFEAASKANNSDSFEQLITSIDKQILGHQIEALKVEITANIDTLANEKGRPPNAEEIREERIEQLNSITFGAYTPEMLGELTRFYSSLLQAELSKHLKAPKPEKKGFFSSLFHPKPKSDPHAEFSTEAQALLRKKEAVQAIQPPRRRSSSKNG